MKMHSEANEFTAAVVFRPLFAQAFSLREDIVSKDARKVACVTRSFINCVSLHKATPLPSSGK